MAALASSLSFIRNDNYSEPQATDMPAKLSFASNEAFVCGLGDDHPPENKYSSLFK